MSAIDATFVVPIVRDESKGGWTIAVLPGSAAILGSRRPIKVAGHIDAQPFQATLLPMGGGTHMVPIKATLFALLGKSSGDEITVRLEQRVG